MTTATIQPVAARRWDATYPGGQWLYFTGDQDGEKLCLYKDLLSLTSTLESLQRENEELRNLTANLRLQAQTHAIEARGANATINEIYQIISGGKGEPGNWRGAKPVREYVEAAKGEILRLETELALSKPVYSRRQIEARVKLLEEALTPFSREGEKWHEMWPDDHIPAIHPKGNVCGSCGAEPDCDVARFTVGDLRRARTALSSTGGEHHGN